MRLVPYSWCQRGTGGLSQDEMDAKREKKKVWWTNESSDSTYILKACIPSSNKLEVGFRGASYSWLRS